MLPQRVHLIGIGGAGMAGLAHYLLRTGRTVTGSDLVRSDASEALVQAGAHVAYGHAATQVDGADLVVISDAIPAGNVELEAARRQRKPLLHRAECLDRLAEQRRAVLVAGSHGKSTTAAMIACVLRSAGRDPAFVIGADVPCLGDIRAAPGTGALFVAEACEAFRNLDSFNPDIAVITNIDDEHVNHYASQGALDAAFAQFAGRAGMVVLSGEDAGVARIRAAPMQAVTSFGLQADCAVSGPAGPGPFVVRIGGEVAGEVVLRLPGDHSRRNALAAIAACIAVGVPFAAIAAGLAGFTGVSRRWQEVGCAAGVRIVDDYAHHPAEIAATLRTARAASPGSRLVVAFQPLLHSRVQRLHAQFAASLALADQVLLLEVDAGGEVGHSVGSAAIADALRRRHVAVALRDDADELVERAPGDLRSGDLLLVMGGDRLTGLAARLQRRLVDTAAARTTDFPRRSGWARRIGEAIRGADSVVALFRAAVRAGRERPALIEPGARLSYGELDRASDAVAVGLALRGLAGRAVGVCLPLSSDLVVAMLGVMKAGCTYLPLDTALPQARRRFMLARAGAGALIARDTAADADTAGAPALDLAGLSLPMLQAGSGRLPPGPTGGDDAYICFTSGSTGAPKGIRIGHAALFALLRDIGPRFGIGTDTRMLLNTSISFDVSVAELCATLATGGALVVGGLRPLVGERLFLRLAEGGVTHLCVTPTVLASMPPDPLPALGWIIACGEVCPPELVRDWAPGRRFFNVYGPTEATIYATAARCHAGAEVTIGTPLGHLAAHVLDAALGPVAVGEIGELCLSGPGVAAGYIEQPEATAAQFVDAAAGRLYRTGDMVRLGSERTLHFIGRLDEQVKILGNRIELGEIERAVLRQPAIAEAAVCVTAGVAPSLVCFVRAPAGHLLDTVALARRLAEWLPDSAVPAHFIPVAAIPLTPSGKKDRRRLLNEHRARIVTRASDFASPRTAIERQVASLWRKVLRLDDDVGMFDRFSALGGDSLAALVLVTELEAAFAVTVPAGYFGRLNTVPQMAVQLAELLWNRAGLPAPGTGFRASRIYRQLRELCGHWPGERRRPDSLISTLGSQAAAHDLFLCCQNEAEFISLGSRLPPSFRLHGMRSGHLVIDQGPGGLRQLCNHYADEIEAIAPRGTLILGGVCQGSTIAQSVAQTLTARGWSVALLVAIEPARMPAHPGATALFWAEDSFLNPLRPGGHGSAAFEQTLTGGYSIDTVPGNHGGVCLEPGVRFLVQHLARRVDRIAGRPHVVA